MRTIAAGFRLVDLESEGRRKMSVLWHLAPSTKSYLAAQDAGVGSLVVSIEQKYGNLNKCLEIDKLIECCSKDKLTFIKP